MELAKYQRKRDFGKTPEPQGKVGTRGGRLYVIQKHAARRLHFDFRLELNGVLKSWAVPKGPSIDPAKRRLAVHVEDHPIEYGDFEGIIPKPEYGAGTVLLWDRGTWESHGDPAEDYARGNLRFQLKGARLHGEWALVRMDKASRNNGDNWLLIKLPDEAAGGEEPTDRFQRSVVSDQTLEDIGRPIDDNTSSHPHQRAQVADSAPPEWLSPELAVPVDLPPEGDEWLHEIKFDGYRVLCRISEGHVRLLSRNGKDWTTRLGVLARAIRRLPAKNAWLDGEIAVLLSGGTTSFPALQQALSEKREEALVYFLFDLLHLNGRDLTHLRLLERKQLLADLLAQQTTEPSPLRFSDHVVGNGRLFFSEACRLGLEGSVSKRLESPYSGTRTRNWQKAKCLNRQEFVVGGYTEPRGAREGFGALLLGYYDEGSLRYAGRVGTGFDEDTLHNLATRLKPLTQSASPFAEVPRKGTRGQVHWVAPRLVAEVAFAGWTREGYLRMPTFQGLREDKEPSTVVRERPESQTPPAVQARGLPGTVRDLRLSNPDKILYPAQGLTKRQLAEYYEAVAQAMLPDVSDRPLTLLRCPNGPDGGCFFQKHAAASAPPEVRRILIEEKGRERTYMAIDSPEGLIGLVQMGVLEVHVWGARCDRPEQPDRMVLDLDPAPDTSWSAVMDAALDLRALLDELGLVSFVRTTGGKGLHVVVPLVRRNTWEELKSFSRALAVELAAEKPAKYTAKLSKERRGGKVFIDYLRNMRGATAIGNYSTRAREGATVATPLDWDELSLGLNPDHFNIITVPERLRTTAPWHRYSQARQSITRQMLKSLRLI